MKFSRQSPRFVLNAWLIAGGVALAAVLICLDAIFPVDQAPPPSTPAPVAAKSVSAPPPVNPPPDPPTTFKGGYDPTLPVSPQIQMPPVEPETPAADNPPNISRAWRLAKDYVRDNLKAPSSASFGDGFWDWTQGADRCVTCLGVNEAGDRLYYISGWVDAENAFGAKLRTKWGCALTESPGGDWQRAGIIIADE